MTKRFVFFISDGTGITAENLGHCLITQFDDIEFESQTIPYVNTEEKARKAVKTLDEHFEKHNSRPIIFATLVDPDLRAIIKTSHGRMLDLFDVFIAPLENELGKKSTYRVGKTHSIANFDAYKIRIDAVNFALAHDDGVAPQHYQMADIIILGVSRSGKTPTSLYLALQFGVRAANYPLTDEDLAQHDLPDLLKPYQKKLFGLTIEPERLHNIRKERRANSQYASLTQCRHEIRHIEAMFQQARIPYVNTTLNSVEEIATKILATTGIERRVF